MGLFADLPVAPVDPILGTALAYNADTDPRKVNLGIGAYRTEEGKPYILPVVKAVSEELVKELGTSVFKEYATIDGPPGLKAATQSVVFGEGSEPVTSGRIASVQGLSGTGSLRVAGEFIKTFMKPEAHEIWISNPTWGNHPTIFRKAGMTVKEYSYYDPATKGFDYEGTMRAIRDEASEGSIILLHACAHNPTGVDPTEDQWREIAKVMQERRLIPLMDSAYQGYASGSLDKDAFAVRLFVSMGFELFMCQSFAKNLGLYGERIGMLHVLCKTPEAATAVLSQLKMVIRPMYSSPPIHGALLVERILGNASRLAQWKKELKEMAERVLEVRDLLRKGLEAKGTPGTWNHVTDQIGMFSYTGLSPAQCEYLTEKHHIYLLKSGRISLAGLNKGNIQYVVNAFDDAVRACP